MLTANLGFPRIGERRQLKKAVERYWHEDLAELELQEIAAKVRAVAWSLQRDCSCHFIPTNDLSFYDQVLDTTAMLAAVPERFGWSGQSVDLSTYFAMARGRSGVPAMEMTKWFDTNYHYIVPEFRDGQTFRLADTKVIDEFQEAQKIGVRARPVLLGPVSYLLLGKMADGGRSQLTLLDAVLPVYAEVLSRLAEDGAEWVQLDEPALVTDLPSGAAEAYRRAYDFFTSNQKLNVILTTYFGSLGDNLSLATSLPVDGLHIDLVRGPQQLQDILVQWPEQRWLSLGVVDGRNIWRCNLDAAYQTLQAVVQQRGPERLLVAPSCSLMHVPHDLEMETRLDEELRSWMAFAKQKLQELTILARAVNDGADTVADEFQSARTALQRRANSEWIKRDAVRMRCRTLDPTQSQRQSPFAVRQRKQHDVLGMPLFPTTTIGSFPQTAKIRKARADHRAGKISDADYEDFLEREIAQIVSLQEELGLDVLVHGEPERNDMVEYFGEHLEGFAFTQHGWVQSYGSRCVKPPIVYGDVERRGPMTVRWSRYAQSLTSRHMKGILTGPVTILQWSFVRDDQPRRETCRQIALALRDEVLDLEQAGIRIIQIDEPALREGLPLRRGEWDVYLTWATECFRIVASGVADETQIHSHMCYAEFNDILPAISALDADVISIESSRSRMDLLGAFRDQAYPNQIGPGVYDIHSPRIPSTEEMVTLLQSASKVLSREQIWVNPDCGLKTRGWPEVKESLRHMVAAAKQMRGETAMVKQ